MSEKYDASLNHDIDDEEREQYFATNLVSPTVSFHGNTSLMGPKTSTIGTTKSMELENELTMEEGGNTGDPNSTPAQSSDVDWTVADDGANSATPITAYLSAFFMTIATVLVRETRRKTDLHLCAAFNLIQFSQSRASGSECLIL